MGEGYYKIKITNSSFFHDGENFICQIYRIVSHTINENHVFNYVRCYFVNDKDSGCKEQIDEEEYFKKLAQHRAEGYIEEEHEFGYQIKWMESSYRWERFGDKVPDIGDFIGRLDKIRNQKKEAGMGVLEEKYRREHCRGEVRKFNIGDKVIIDVCRAPRHLRIKHKQICGKITEITGTYFGRGGSISYYVKDGMEPLPAENLIPVDENSTNDFFTPRVGDYVCISGDYFNGTHECNGENGTIIEIDSIGMCTIRIDESDKWITYFNGRPVKVWISQVELVKCIYCLNPCHKITYPSPYISR